MISCHTLSSTNCYKNMGSGQAKKIYLFDISLASLLELCHFNSFLLQIICPPLKAAARSIMTTCLDADWLMWSSKSSLPVLTRLGGLSQCAHACGSPSGLSQCAHACGSPSGLSQCAHACGSPSGLSQCAHACGSPSGLSQCARACGLPQWSFSVCSYLWLPQWHSNLTGYSSQCTNHVIIVLKGVSPVFPSQNESFHRNRSTCQLTHFY